MVAGIVTKNFTNRELKQKVLFQDIVGFDQLDQKRVKHCVLFHQFNRNYEPCRGITYDKVKPTSLKEVRMEEILNNTIKEVKKKLGIDLSLDQYNEEDLVKICM